MSHSLTLESPTFSTATEAAWVERTPGVSARSAMSILLEMQSAQHLAKDPTSWCDSSSPLRICLGSNIWPFG